MGNVPMLRTFTGAAKKWKPASGNCMAGFGKAKMFEAAANRGILLFVLQSHFACAKRIL